MMILVKNEYFSFHKILLLTVGLWPYHRSKLVEFQLFLFLGILSSFIMFQFTILITTECTVDLVLKIVSYTSYFSILLVKYNSFCINADTVKCLLEKLQHACDELKDKNEIAIIQKYGNEAKRYTIIILTYTTFHLIIFILLPIWPQIVGIFLVINASEPFVMMQIMTEYFIDQEKYFYLILLHMDIAVCIGALAVIGPGTLLITLFKYVCGMFKIASYRIEQAMAINMFKGANLPNEIIISQKIVHAVDIHLKALELCDIFKSNFSGSFFVLIMVGVTSASINLYRVMLLGNAMEDLLTHLAFLIVICEYMLIGNYVGQEIIDHYNHIFTIVLLTVVEASKKICTYDVHWYVATLRIQKTILFLLQRGTKPFKLVLGGIFVVSMESAAMLMSASISYFTVLYSTRQDP